MQQKVLELLSGRQGHFLLESGHHGDLWLDLETLCLQPQRVQEVAAGLAAPLSDQQVDAVCGPLAEGAFVALIVALQLGIQFTYTERFARPVADGLFPAGYRVPTPLRATLRGKRVAIVDDVINAGSAIREHSPIWKSVARKLSPSAVFWFWVRLLLRSLRARMSCCIISQRCPAICGPH